jgi:hypothetical protein
MSKELDRIKSNINTNKRRKLHDLEAIKESLVKVEVTEKTLEEDINLIKTNFDKLVDHVIEMTLE